MNKRNPLFPCGRVANLVSRREWLCRAGAGAGMIGLAGLLADEKLLAAETEAPNEPITSLVPRPGHFPAKVKSVIWLFMEGAPSAVDMFDRKPGLDKMDGKKTDIQAFFGNPGPLMKSPFSFKQYGECGQWVCDKYTNVAQHVDKMAFIKSCYSESNDHVPAIYQINSGLPRPGFPTAGAWVTYGLGSENQNLPGYVVMGNTQGAKGGPHNWGSGFLPSTFQGTLFRSQGTPVLNLKRQPQITKQDQRAQLDLMAKLNDEHMQRHTRDAEFANRMQSFELAFRMQKEATEVVDLSRETPAMHELYGLNNPRSKSYGSKCLMARRLVESGVRFIQVYSDGEWDAHDNLEENHTHHCAATDVPVAGLLTDLEARGLLDSTLVIWGGEFGRMPISQNGKGRDHNPKGFLQWMAGAGIKGGVSYGETDDIGYEAVENPVSVNDLHATILHLLGLNHERLTYFHNGRSYRLTDVAGKVIQEILA
ncbi:DUF1501 domain-containing protein [Bremerella cremea]|uniref:DUF1501 domain-containing protein n=1 Tax=Blastopirellula marina TaxID=124 RepID=A0A2S8FZ27_9BACT|nr:MULTISPECIES: DUF1501 domain-containing protein [Pirellulaceae]PQO37449.1 DUF1501 domain-containing protein [Blastopirellula marina]RCS49836.1 DUF1501 domain-containing protein [Bremerella cremea]